MEAENNIRVTYLITTLNRADYLEHTLENVREFIEPQDELIIIDGLSSDHTAEVIAKHQDIVTVFVSEKDYGEGHAFNKGLFRARGRFLKPITDDDYFCPESMRQLVQTMESHPDVDAILCGGEVWRIEGGQPVFQCYRFLPPELPATANTIFDHANIGLGLIVRHSMLERTGGVSTNYVSVDGDLVCRILECSGRLSYLDLNLYKWHIHPHSGFNKSLLMRRDSLLISLRLGRWDHLFSYNPEELADITHYREKLGGVWQLYVIWAVSKLVETPFRPLIFIMGMFLRTARLFWRALRQVLRSPVVTDVITSEAAEFTPERQWTGLLR